MPEKYTAGGNIAAAVCQKAADTGTNLPGHLMLLYPTVDYNPERESVKKFWLTPGFAGCDYSKIYEYYLKNRDCDMPQYAMPFRASDVSGLSPVYMEVMECDPLHDEGCAYAQKLEKSCPDAALLYVEKFTLFLIKDQGFPQFISGKPCINVIS